jgi:UDP-2,3-diacylglucosamine hydrolase
MSAASSYAGRSPVLFISDLHLSAEREEVTRIFVRFLANEARSAQALYILGDLFDYWIGDDNLNEPLHSLVIDSLRVLAQRGCTIKLMHGNRDFLLGDRFAEASGVQLIADPHLIDLFGCETLLMHGDTLCTGDIAYQEFRLRVRAHAWQSEFLAKSLAERRAITLGLRRESAAKTQFKSAEIMDVTPQAVVQALSDRSCTRLIHGHTHRPARHEHLLAERIHERWVLADWNDRGETLRVDPGGITRITLR